MNEPTYRLLKGPEGLAQAQAEWNALEQNTGQPYFQSYAFARAWYETLGYRVDAEPRIVIFQDERGPVGLFPACVVRTHGIRVITWMGTPHATDSGDVLFDPSQTHTSADEFVRHALLLLRSEDRRTPFLFPNVSDGAIVGSVFTDEFHSYRHGVILSVPTKGRAERYLGSLTSQQRNTLHRRVKKLKRDGDYRFTLRLPQDEVVDVMRHLFDLKVKQREAAGLKTDLVDEDYLAFCMKQIDYGIDGFLSTLEFNGQTVAGWFNILHNGRLYGVFTAYDPEYRPYSPGTVLTWFVMEDCFKRELAAYDLGWSGDAYKYEWLPEEIVLSTFLSKGLIGTLMLVAALARNRFVRLTDPHEAARRLGRGATPSQR